MKYLVLNPQVFKRAAKEIDFIPFSCIALKRALNLYKLTDQTYRLLYKQRYEDYFRPDPDQLDIECPGVWYGMSGIPENDLARELALLFMAEMLVSGHAPALSELSHEE